MVDGDADWSTECLPAGAQESTQHVNHGTVGMTLPEGHEHDLVTAVGTTVPGAMLADEHAGAEGRGQAVTR